MAVATMTPAQPSSMAKVASDAVPIPASRTTGTEHRSAMRAMLCGLRMPRPLPMGAPRGMTAAQPDLLEAAGQHGVVVGVGQDDEALVAQLLGGVEQLHGVGQQGVLVPDDLELDPVGLERLAGELGREDRLRRGETARRVGQDLDAPGPEHVEDAAARRGVDAAHGHGGQRRCPTPRRRRRGPRGSRCRRCRGRGASRGRCPAMTKSSVASSTSASGRRRHDLDHVARRQRRRRPTRCGARPRGCAPRRCRPATCTTTATDVGHRACPELARPGRRTGSPFTLRRRCGGVRPGACRSPTRPAWHLGHGPARAGVGAKRPGPNGANSSGGSPPESDRQPPPWP